jgi:hypothetical protein
MPKAISWPQKAKILVPSRPTWGIGIFNTQFYIRNWIPAVLEVLAKIEETVCASMG